MTRYLFRSTLVTIDGNQLFEKFTYHFNRPLNVVSAILRKAKYLPGDRIKPPPNNIFYTTDKKKVQIQMFTSIWKKLQCRWQRSWHGDISFNDEGIKYNILLISRTIISSYCLICPIKQIFQKTGIFSLLTTVLRCEHFSLFKQTNQNKSSV